MSNQKQVVVRKGLGLGSILTIIFVIAKVFEVGVVAKWSWPWVFSPLWIPIVVAVAIVLVCTLIGGLASILVAAIEKYQSNKRKK